jgi:hypothetical protein
MGFFAWLAYVALIYLSYVGGTMSKYAFYDDPGYSVTQNVPVRAEVVRLSSDPTDAGVRLTNLSDDYLLAAYVGCTIDFDNGQPIEYTFRSGFGGNIPYPKGFQTTIRVITRTDMVTNRADYRSMRCQVEKAEYIGHPKVSTTTRFELNPGDHRTDLFVTNNSTSGIKNIQFMCVRDNGRPLRVDAYPSYLTDVRKDTIVKPNETVKFTTKDNIWRYTSCEVINAVVIK